MSEPIPESIPTSADRRSHRPTKKRALTPSSLQTSQVDALFAHPERTITIPTAGGGAAEAPRRAAPPEIVANVQGSSAGAGSGEFHVYKASRRREYERLRTMDEEVERERADREFEERRAKMRRADEERLEKNRAKREKARKRKMRKEKGRKGAEGEGEGNGEAVGAKSKLGAARVASGMMEAGSTENGEDGANTNGQVAEVEDVGMTIHDDD